MNDDLHLTPKEAAAHLRVSEATLERWRRTGAIKGHVPPRFVKRGKKVFYPMSELRAYDQRQLRSHNNEAPPHE